LSAPSVLVTGSSGLLGRCLVERLRARGSRLRLLDVVPPPEPPPADAEFVRADMRDAAATAAACRGVEVVYHTAAGQRMKPQFAAMSERELFAMNVAALDNVLAGALAHGVRKLVHLSSSGVYGIPRTIPVTEEHPQRPLGAYGRSKIAAEERCGAALAQGLDVTMLRPMSLFGPGMTGVFMLLFDWVRQGKNVYLLGAGQNRVQMASAWDVADACLLAAERPASRGAVLNLGAEEVPTVRAQVEGLIAHAGTGSRVVPLPAQPLRTAARLLHPLGLSPIVPEHYLLADTAFVLDVARAKEVLGWRPRYSNLQMTVEAYDWYRVHWRSHQPAPSLALRLLNALS
jgi:nucleoside-diphosphate-sugar epimerase